MPSQTPVVCQVCKRELPPSRCVPAAAVRPALARLILKDRPDWVSTGHICHADLNRFRAQHVQWMLESEKGTLTRLEAASERSSRDDQTVTRKLMEETGEPPTFGQNMADLVARFGGSWRFLILFAGFLVLWISGNAAIALVAHARAFDRHAHSRPFVAALRHEREHHGHVGVGARGELLLSGRAALKLDAYRGHGVRSPCRVF